MSNSTLSYKQRKVDFVSNLSGGSISEINYVTLVAPVCCLVYTDALGERKKKKKKKQGFEIGHLANYVAV
jgi:hypothetical protein